MNNKLSYDEFVEAIEAKYGIGMFNFHLNLTSHSGPIIFAYANPYDAIFGKRSILERKQLSCFVLEDGIVTKDTLNLFAPTIKDTPMNIVGDWISHTKIDIGSVKHKCNCPMIELMRYGCKCGGE